MKNYSLSDKKLAFLVIVPLGILIYSNTFQAGFHLDDVHSITENFSIRNLSNLSSIWGFSKTRFFTQLTFAMNYHCGGLNVFGYHVVNILIHIANGLLVFFLARQTFETPALRTHPLSGSRTSIALFAALVFLTHPLQTQSVTYIVQRAALLATLCYLGALNFYAKARLIRGFHYYVPALVLAVIAMFTKQIAFTLPLAISLYDVSFFKDASEKPGARFLKLIPFLLTLGIIPFLMWVYRSSEIGQFGDLTKETTAIGRSAYLLTQFNVVRTYIRLLFFPMGQNLDYDYPVASSFMEPATFLSFLALSGIFLVALTFYRKHRPACFGVLWFFLTLSVESSFIPIRDVIFEHRLYLPMVGFAFFLSVTLCSIVKNVRAFFAVVAAVILLFSALTYRRNFVWKNDLTLWQDVLKKSPGKARTYDGLGFAYGELGDTEKAIANYEKAIKLDPSFAKAYHNLGIALNRAGKLEEAIPYYQKAIELGSKSPKTWDNLGVAYGKKGDFENAITCSKKAIEFDPLYAKAYNNLAVTYSHLGDFKQAIPFALKAIEIDPRFAEAYSNLAVGLIREGDLAGAREQITRLMGLGRSDLAERVGQLLGGKT